MAIHNTIEIMRPNWIMFIGGVFMLVIGLGLATIAFNAEVKIGGAVVALIIGIFMTVTGAVCMIKHDDPEFQKPTGKKQIEVVFLNDEIPINILDEYDVVERRGDIFVLEEK